MLNFEEKKVQMNTENRIYIKQRLI